MAASAPRPMLAAVFDRDKARFPLVVTPKIDGVRVVARDGKQFKVGTGFTAADRQKLWAEREKIAGRLVKFKHMESGAITVPRHPVFVGLRSPLDLDVKSKFGPLGIAVAVGGVVAASIAASTRSASAGERDESQRHAAIKAGANEIGQQAKGVIVGSIAMAGLAAVSAPVAVVVGTALTAKAGFDMIKGAFAGYRSAHTLNGTFMGAFGHAYLNQAAADQDLKRVHIVPAPTPRSAVQTLPTYKDDWTDKNGKFYTRHDTSRRKTG